MDKKKTTRKPTKRRKRAKKKPGRRVLTIGELNAKAEEYGEDALTPSEYRTWKGLGKSKDRRKTTDLTLAELEALAANGKISSGQMKELSELRKAVDRQIQSNTIRPVLTIRERLESIQNDILNALIEELTNGRGIARITAAERLKMWSKEEGVGTTEGADEEIAFMNPLAEQTSDDIGAA